MGQGECFIYMGDHDEGNVAAPKKDQRIRYSISRGAEFVTISQVIQNLKRILGEVKVEHKPSRLEDFRGAKVSISKAEQLLGWKP